MIIHKPHLLTTLQIWAPRYSDAHTDGGERVALLAKYKVDYASPIILIEFTKAKHLLGQRYCIEREVAQKFPLSSNSKIPCYSVPMSALQQWQTATEVREIAEALFD